MVVFTCNHCGESLHKPKVEKHYQFACRNNKSVTCIDCFKDFRDEEYVVHTKCLTEEERYAAKGTYKNGIVKKGEQKQESWVEMINSICHTEQNLTPSARNLLNTISGYSNVPRKKIKFMNFIKSSSGGRVNMKDIEEVWDIIEKYKAKNQANQNSKATENQENKSNGETQKPQETKSVKRVNENEESEPIKKKKKNENEESEPLKKKNKNENEQSEPLKKKKKKNETESTVEISEVAPESDNFSFKEKILEILTKKGSISNSKLQKKVLKAYLNVTGETECSEKIVKKYRKKLSKIPNLSMEDDKVILVG